MPRTASQLHDGILECDRAVKTLKGAGFEHMAQVTREQRSRLVHELKRQAALGSRTAATTLRMLKIK